MSLDTPQDTEVLSYSIDRAAGIIGVSKATLYRMMRDGEIKVSRVRGRTLVPRTSLVKVLEDGMATN